MNRNNYVSGEYQRPSYSYHNVPGLNLYFGGRASGKTTAMAKMIEESHAEGKKWAVLFPEYTQAMRFKRYHLPREISETMGNYIMARGAMDAHRGISVDHLFLDDWNESEDINHYWHAVTPSRDAKLIVMTNQNVSIKYDKRECL